MRLYCGLSIIILPAALRPEAVILPARSAIPFRAAMSSIARFFAWFGEFGVFCGTWRGPRSPAL